MTAYSGQIDHLIWQSLNNHPVLTTVLLFADPTAHP